MSLVMFVIFLLVGAATAAKCPSDCNNNPPLAGQGLKQYSCEQQVSWGKCVRGWMQGYCECACGVCEYEPETLPQMVPELEIMLTPTPTPTPQMEVPLPEPEVEDVIVDPTNIFRQFATTPEQEAV